LDWKKQDIKIFVQEQLLNGKIIDSFKYEKIKQEHSVLVCTHMTKDKRCGKAGPIILKQIEDIVSKLNLGEKILAMAVSHIGGHKYAGVAIVYPEGDWYGFVTKKNITEILSGYMDSSKDKEQRISKNNFRGKMGEDRSWPKIGWEPILPPRCVQAASRWKNGAPWAPEESAEVGERVDG